MQIPNGRISTLALGLRWTARAWSVVSLGLILLFFVGEGFAPADVGPQEWIGLLFFPVGVVVGMVIAWWKEGWGSGLCIVSFLAFYLVYGLGLRGDLPRRWAFSLFAAPGILFLACWLLSRSRSLESKL
jgi:hypothetical protein